jgi:hypothetical protein
MTLTSRLGTGNSRTFFYGVTTRLDLIYYLLFSHTPYREMFRLSSHTYDFGPEPIPTKFRSFSNSVGAQGSGYISYEDNCQSSDVLINEAEGKYVDQSWKYINRSQRHECGNWD